MAKDFITKASFTATGKIKEIKIKKGGQKIQICDVVITDSQVSKVKEMLELGGVVKVTAEAVQRELFDGKAAAAGEK